ncbi:hypothetical protein K458DRAFT_424843 [Lentithecium fluviatile CBS 122367]|uniref:Uncharacterized protein n=1 Tax=Lentithecium fluviatile CBS 122367 TaxID=1168545 RepID=A0A6G1IE21_9PLEO|nr:hypothetical protein K458DRAFT_424843 [Lentithecium fluviatile CBS 122367]
MADVISTPYWHSSSFVPLSPGFGNVAIYEPSYRPFIHSCRPQSSDVLIVIGRASSVGGSRRRRPCRIGLSSHLLDGLRGLNSWRLDSRGLAFYRLTLLRWYPQDVIQLVKYLFRRAFSVTNRRVRVSGAIPHIFVFGLENVLRIASRHF